MKLDDWTLTVLQNFQTMNPSLVLKPGKEINVISPTRTVVGSATVTDEFDKEVAIFDMAKFLGIYNMNEGSEVIFNDKDAVIKSKNGTCTYRYCNPQLITTPKKIDMSAINTYVWFDLKEDVLKNVIKALSVLGLTDVAFTGDGNKLRVSAMSLKNPTSDTFDVEIGETDKVFSAYMEVTKFRLLQDDYNVKITPEGIAYFKMLGLPEDKSLTYSIGLNIKSKFEG